MVRQIEIMVAAVVIAVLFMMLFAGVIGDFVHRHPTLKMLALSFLLLIGVTLIADGFEQHIPRGYIYFAMGFSVFVEMLNLRLRKTCVPPSNSANPIRPRVAKGLPPRSIDSACSTPLVYQIQEALFPPTNLTLHALHCTRAAGLRASRFGHMDARSVS